MVTENEKLLKLRIQHLLSIKKTSLSTIAESESERVMLGRQINGESTVVSYRTLYKLLYMFPDISADWLIMGEGSMYKADHTAPHIYNTRNEANGSSAGGSIFVGSSTIPYPVQALLDEKDKRIAELEKDKAQLQSFLSIFTRQAEEQKPKKR